MSLKTICLSFEALCLALSFAKGGNCTGFLIGEHDLPKLVFILVNVTLQGTQQQFRMFGSEDNTTAHIRLGQAWQRTGKVNNELTMGMADERKVTIHAMGNFWAQVHLNLVLRLFIIFVFHLLYI